MTRKKICKGFPQKLTQALVVLLLSTGGGMLLPHQAHSQEDGTPTPASPPDNEHQIITTPLGTAVDPQGMEQEYGPNWQDILANHEKRLAEFQADETAGRQAATMIVASEVNDMDDLVKTYPFLQQDFQNVKDTQQTALNYMNAHPDESSAQSPDNSPHIQVAESKDPQTGINVLFVSKSGRLWCGAHGCSMDIYVDTGTGYQKASSKIVHSDIYLARFDGKVALFFGPPQDPETAEWLLKDHEFVVNKHPE